MRRLHALSTAFPHASSFAFLLARSSPFSIPPNLCACISRRTESTVTLKAAGAHPKYKPLEDVENLERYRAGGYHPIVIGDRLHGRYRIAHKLGFGAYSTIWLAKDEKAGVYFSLKIEIADGNSRESNILRELGAGDQRHTHPGKAVIPTILDDFAVKGPNGEHRCVVTAPARMSLSDAREASYTRIFLLPVARAIAAQLTHPGRSFLALPRRRPCRCVMEEELLCQVMISLSAKQLTHRPDIHVGNVLLRLPQRKLDVSPNQLYAQYGQPTYEPIGRLDNEPLAKCVPSHGTKPVWLGKDSELITLSEASIFLSDSGEAFTPSTTERLHSNTPALSAPPETRFMPQTPLSFSADIWSLACTVYSIMGARPLFEGFAPTADWMTKEHVTVLGKLPPEWWDRWDTRSRWFDEDGSRNNLD